MPAELVLASTSSSRVAMLRAAGVTFGQANARIDEAAVRASLEAEGMRPHDIADALAELKALKISDRFSQALVIGCDQVLDLDGEVLGKADDKDSLRRQLLRLRGRQHRLHSAAVIAQAGKPVWRHVATARLAVRAFSEQWLDGYLSRQWPAVSGSVGGYHIEGEGIRLFSAVEGSWPVILGMPLVEILGYLGQRGDIES